MKTNTQWDANFILTSVYGTAGAILLGVPVGFLTAVYLAKMAPKKAKAVMGQAVSMLAGIPSVVYGLVGMMVLVPGIRKVFGVPDGASLLAAMIVLAIMILPAILKMSVTALEAVPKEYEDASLALGATPEETLQAQQLGIAISDFLRQLPEQSRHVFVGRYYYCDSVKDVARYCGISEAKAKTLLYRIRCSLKEYLCKEGFAV